MNKYSIKLKNKNSILFIHANSENLSARIHEFNDIGFSVAKVTELKKWPIALNMRLK